MIFSLFRSRGNAADPYPLYQAIVDQARHVAFYRELGVDDSLDGRFDLITLHAFLVFDTLGRRDRAAAELSQAAFDLMFKDMDRSLRERGVGDVSVPKKVKAMAEAFYGRSEAYRAALDMADRSVLADALFRNVYAGEGSRDVAGRLADYVLRAAGVLANADTGDFRAGAIAWPHVTEGTVATAADVREGVQP